jgi:succinate dehydrogenase / fumarate reductase cytochrome b subunit
VGRGCCTAFTGVAIFFFLLVHVLDTALIRLSPEA